MRVVKRRPPADGSWRVVPPRLVPLYCARYLLPESAAALRAWALSQGFESTVPEEEFHATICYSAEPVDLARIDPAPPYLRVGYGGPRSVEPLGDKGAAVLRFESPELELRWKELRYAGAKWDYPSFQPHITISYQTPATYLEGVTPFAGELVFGPERFEELREDFAPPVEKKLVRVPLERGTPPTIAVAKARRRGPRDRRIKPPKSFLRSDLRAAREIMAVAQALEPRVAAAFVEAARAMRDETQVRALAAAIESGDFGAAVRLAQAATLPDRLRGAGVRPGAASYVDELVDTFRAGGDAAMRAMPKGAGLRASLDLTNPAAVQYLQSVLPARITALTAESLDAVRQALLRGFREGRPAPLIAREIKESIGLTSAQQNAVANFRRQLETGQMGAGVAPWDRRLSAAEASQARSIFSGGGASGAQVDSLVARYADSLLTRRAKDIARTEVTRAFGEGQNELWRQAQERGLLDPERTRRVWVVTPDDRLRDDHAAVPDMNPDGVRLDEPFDTPIGPVMGPRESGDPSFDVNCRCTVALEFVGGDTAEGSEEA